MGAFFRMYKFGLKRAMVCAKFKAPLNANWEHANFFIDVLGCGFIFVDSHHSKISIIFWAISSDG